MFKATLQINQCVIRVNVAVLFCVLIAVTVLLKLGLWQLDRAQQKRAANTEMELRQARPAQPFDTDKFTQSGDIAHTRVQLRGRFVLGHSVLIDNQYYQGVAGYEVLTPFQLADYDRQLLVSRGWLTQANYPLESEVASGIIVVDAQLYTPASSQFFKQQLFVADQWPQHLHHFDFVTIQKMYGDTLLPYVARLEKGQPYVLTRHWPVIRDNPTVHTRYAIQWFVMCFGLLVGVLLASSNLLDVWGLRAARDVN